MTSGSLTASLHFDFAITAKAEGLRDIKNRGRPGSEETIERSPCSLAAFLQICNLVLLSISLEPQMSGWESTQAETKAINNLLPTGHNPTSTEREGNKTHCWLVADLQKLIEASETLNDQCSWCACMCVRVRVLCV